MKTKGMTFTTDEVRALIEGRKTQMRKPIKFQVEYSESVGFKYVDKLNKLAASGIGSDHKATVQNFVKSKSPYSVGDLIYVREPHAFVPATAYRCSAGIEQTIHPHNEHNACVYKENFDRCVDFTWFSGARMPRWPSRLTLKVTSVRVERVQNISKQDAEAEGFKLPPVAGMSYAIGARTNFRMAWERLYGESWSRNDWVWVIDFEVIRKNVDIHLAGEAGMNKPIITANNNGIRLPEEYQLAIVKNGKIIDAGQHIADQAFRAVGQAYLDAIDKYIDKHKITNILKDNEAK